jgi:hypothetical protein
MNASQRARDLIAAGATPYELGARVARGDLVRVRRGAYADAVGLTREDAHLRLLRATLAELGPDAVASHASAALLHGLPVAPGELGLVRVTRRSATHGRSGPGFRQSTAALAPGEVVEVGGVPCTSSARTAIDVACSASFGWGVGACDAVLHLELADADALAQACASATGRRGVHRARAAVAFADGRAASVLESLSRVQLRRLGLPTPELQFEVTLDGRVVATSDFAWPEFGVVGEADGTQKYVDQAFDQRTGAEVIRDEKRREGKIRDAGWWITRWDWDLVHRPAAFERRIRAAFAHAARPRAVA